LSNLRKRAQKAVQEPQIASQIPAMPLTVPLVLDLDRCLVQPCRPGSRLSMALFFSISLARRHVEVVRLRAHGVGKSMSPIARYLQCQVESAILSGKPRKYLKLSEI
jgi:hypothetical protein